MDLCYYCHRTIGPQYWTPVDMIKFDDGRGWHHICHRDACKQKALNDPAIDEIPTHWDETPSSWKV